MAQLAEAVGFEDVDAIRRLARRTVLLQPRAGIAIDASCSRLGGLPSLPSGSIWPTHEGRSLAFIAQINLGDMPSWIQAEGFPGSGLLAFFYDAEQSTWGFDPADAGSFVVQFCPDVGSVQSPSNWPGDLPEYAHYSPCELVAEEMVTLPPWDSVLVDELGLVQAQLDRYMDLLEACSSDQPWAVRTLLGGYPDQIQGDMMLECELVSAGLSCGDSAAYQDARLPLFKKQARRWRQLLQVQSCDDTGMMWGDVGCLYYWIRESDLLARSFDAAWMILQCG